MKRSLRDVARAVRARFRSIDRYHLVTAACVVACASFIVIGLCYGLSGAAPSLASDRARTMEFSRLLVAGLWSALGLLSLAAAALSTAAVRLRAHATRAHAAEAKQRAVLEAIPDLLFVLDREGVFVQYQGAERSVLLAPPEAFIGRRYEEVLPPSLAEKLKAAVEEARDTGQTVRIEYSIEMDGERWFEAGIRCIGDGRTLAICRDVTSLVEAARQAAELAGLRRALDAHSLFSITDRRGRILDINAGFCRISGFAREELLGQDHRILNSGHHPPEFWRQMWATIGRGQPWRSEVCNRAKDGSLYWVDSTNVPILGADGRVERYISLRFDITSRKTLEIERARSEARFRALFDGSDDAVVLFDVTDALGATPRATDGNAAALRMFGVDSLEALQRLDVRRVSPRHQDDGRPSLELVQEHLARALREGCHRFEWLCRRVDDGAPFYVEVALSTHKIDGRVVLQCVIRDVTERVQARRRLTSIFEALAEGLILMDSDGRILDCNPAATTILGIGEDEVRGRSPRDPRWRAIREDGSDLPPQEMPAEVTRLTNKPVRAFVHGIVRPDGETRWLSVSSEPIRDASGAVRGVVASMADVTVQQNQSSQLEGQRAELQAIVDAIPGVMFYKDGNNTILDLNRAAAESMGVDREAIRGRATEEFFPEDDARAYLSDDREVLRSGKPKLGIVERYVAGGRTYHVRTDKIPLVGPSGQLDRLVAIITDITETVEALERVRAAERRLELAVRASNTGLWEWDVRTGRTTFSDTWFTMLGYDPAELPMDFSTWERLCHPEDLPVARAELERHFTGLTPVYRCEHRLRSKGGGWMWVRGVGEVIERGPQGEPLLAVGVNIDVQALREALAKAEDASVAKSEFLANTSHEIRTPMTAILGYSELLVDPTCDPHEITDYAAIVQSSASHLLSLLDDILDMSKIEAGRMRVERIETSLAHLVEDVASLARPRATSKGLELRVEYDTPVPSSLQTDPTRCRQILLNLVGNAVKFTEEGAVTLRVSCDAEAERARFAVVDTGIGMSKEQRDVIARFEAFTQADGSTTRRFGGTGLGLRISSALAMLLGGKIEVESIEGAGSTFTLTIETGSLDGIPPWEPDASAMSDLPATALERTISGVAAPPSAQSGAGPLAGLHILVAEDGPDNQRLIRHHLERAGAQVSVAENGLLAVHEVRRLSEEGRPHVVIMDMQMPELDGYGATRRLRTEGYRLPIIALTAHAMPGDRERCLDAGCDDYLTKPLDKPALLQTCARWAPQERSPHAAAGPKGHDARPDPQRIPKDCEPPGGDPPLSSFEALDPDLMELIGWFAEGLADRAETLSAAWAAGDRAALEVATHQLAGAAGSYGFPELSDAARSVERALKAHPSGEADDDSRELANAIAELAADCLQARGRCLAHPLFVDPLSARPASRAQ